MRFCVAGEVGDWVNYFTADMEKEMDEVCVEPLKSRGLAFIDRLPESRAE